MQGVEKNHFYYFSHEFAYSQMVKWAITVNTGKFIFPMNIEGADEVT